MFEFIDFYGFEGGYDEEYLASLVALAQDYREKKRFCVDIQKASEILGIDKQNVLAAMCPRISQMCQNEEETLPLIQASVYFDSPERLFRRVTVAPGPYKDDYGKGAECDVVTEILQFTLNQNKGAWDCGYPIAPIRLNQVVFLAPFHPSACRRAQPRLLEMTYNVSITLEASMKTLVSVLLSILSVSLGGQPIMLDNL